MTFYILKLELSNSLIYLTLTANMFKTINIVHANIVPLGVTHKANPKINMWIPSSASS